MNRRKFFGFMAVAPVAVASMPQKTQATGGPMFPLSKGMGLIGEGGGDCIIPLKRKLDGTLGVMREQLRREIKITIDPLFRSPTFREGDGI
jgi:hypothetical protein